MTNISKFRRTKIICTIGPATSSANNLRALMLAGMNIGRLNFSHGDHESHCETIRMIRKISKELNIEVGILQDLAGPKIRLGKLSVPELIVQADETINLGLVNDENPLRIPVNYPHFIEDVSIGDRILLADGRVELQVESKHDNYLSAKVIVGGALHSHKGVNLPTSSLRIPSFTEKDREDLTVGIKEGVDFVALSFVRHEKDLEPVREILNKQEQGPMLIAKIEKPQAVGRLTEILKNIDGLMVARGDLGVEMPLEDVPMVQKRIIHEARAAGKPVITATQMLRSMMENPRPTRAEATDVANAILDGTDALMLSDETAIGEYPLEAVKILNRIAKSTEPYLTDRLFAEKPVSGITQSIELSIGRSACSIAEDLNASAIVAGTYSGSTARLISRFRPASPILGLTPNLQTVRQLSLSWGVIPDLVAPFSEVDDIFNLAVSWSSEKQISKQGDRIVVTAGVPSGKPGTTNLLKVLEIA
ncbi:pyruvate kinase [Thermodesulfobacteriota bacterium]